MSSGKCLQCNLNYNLTDSDGFKCLNCYDGYFLSNDQCIECKSNYKTLEDDNCKYNSLKMVIIYLIINVWNVVVNVKHVQNLL